jgi:hypothetical protein
MRDVSEYKNDKWHITKEEYNRENVKRVMNETE